MSPPKPQPDTPVPAADSETTTRFLFVYGTLMAGAAHPMHGNLSHGADAHGPARLRGRLYDIGHYPGVVDPETPDAEAWVMGELYHLRAPVGPLLQRLDRYEGCGAADPEPREYRRVVRQVRPQVATTADVLVAAWVYLYTWPVADAVYIPDGDYLAHLERRGRSRS